MNEQPDMKGLNQLEAGVNLYKYVCILGMLNFGTPEERKVAKRELHELDADTISHLNKAAFSAAADQLGLTRDEMVSLHGE
ncbi:hypothetical protein OM416_20250 [Paenibacillus sp. LS1]|uniref:hypothetical protein n=1 Tax=Paenibacillus sp. LS1 TaxID=2992120 RepID=UPI00222FBC26|nr:hypothetical protein [Paenibacillus sp. LS1]MCW3793929.1 hypothetical protein [Paenibacillus sp. LS1]